MATTELETLEKKFNDTQTLDEMSILDAADSSEPTLDIEDPVFTLVRCQKRTFLAVAQVQGIRHNNVEVASIPTAFEIFRNSQLGRIGNGLEVLRVARAFGTQKGSGLIL